MSFSNKPQLLRDMEEHLGIECQEISPLTSEDRLTIILFEVCRHIPKQDKTKKGQVVKNKPSLVKP